MTFRRAPRRQITATFVAATEASGSKDLPSKPLIKVDLPLDVRTFNWRFANHAGRDEAGQVLKCVAGSSAASWNLELNFTPFLCNSGKITYFDLTFEQLKLVCCSWELECRCYRCARIFGRRVIGDDIRFRR